MRRFPHRALAFAPLAIVLACSGSSAVHETTDGGAKPETDAGTSSTDAVAAGDGGVAPPLVLPAPTANITWGPNTTFIDEANVSVVKTSDPTTGDITLEAAGVAADKLDLSVGRIVVIYGQMMGKITKSTTAGGTVTLATAQTSLDQAATEAELDWQQALELAPDPSKLAGAMVDGRIVRPKGVVIDHNNLQFTIKVGSYTYGVNMVLMGDSAKLDLTVDKSLPAGAKAHFAATGTIQRFVSQHHVSIHGGKLQQYTSTNPKVQGDLTLTVSAAASANDALSFEVPVPLFEYVTLVGPIPVEMTVGAQFVLNGQMPVDGSVQVQSEFDYDSDLGFAYDGTDVSAKANIGLPTIKKNGTVQSAASSPVAFSGGMGFPRLSVSVFGLPIVASLQPAFVVGGSYTFMPACQTANAEFLAAATYSIGVLGIQGPAGSITLFDQKETLLSSGMCPDGGS